VVDVAEFLVALPTQSDFVVRVPAGEFRIEACGLFVAEVLGPLLTPTEYGASFAN
jgi:hypothetical protein